MNPEELLESLDYRGTVVSLELEVKDLEYRLRVSYDSLADTLKYVKELEGKVLKLQAILGRAEAYPYAQ
jgi:hypothetical protein